MDVATTTYAGIGSRETPEDVLLLMRHAARHLALLGWTLRSGNAPGADQAFSEGAAHAEGAQEIFLPWKSFERDFLDHRGVVPALEYPTSAAFTLASRHHPAWGRLSNGARMLHARNCHQVAGADLATPCRFIMCWTPGGEMRGGTAQALRLAQVYGVKVFNLARPSDRERVESMVDAGTLD